MSELSNILYNFNTKEAISRLGNRYKTYSFEQIPKPEDRKVHDITGRFAPGAQNQHHRIMNITIFFNEYDVTLTYQTFLYHKPFRKGKDKFNSRRNYDHKGNTMLTFGKGKYVIKVRRTSLNNFSYLMGSKKKGMKLFNYRSIKNNFAKNLESFLHIRISGMPGYTEEKAEWMKKMIASEINDAILNMKERPNVTRLEKPTPVSAK